MKFSFWSFSKFIHKSQSHTHTKSKALTSPENISSAGMNVDRYFLSSVTFGYLCFNQWERKSDFMSWGKKQNRSFMGEYIYFR